MRRLWQFRSFDIHSFFWDVWPCLSFRWMLLRVFRILSSILFSWPCRRWLCDLPNCRTLKFFLGVSLQYFFIFVGFCWRIWTVRINFPLKIWYQNTFKLEFFNFLFILYFIIVCGAFVIILQIVTVTTNLIVVCLVFWFEELEVASYKLTI